MLKPYEGGSPWAFAVMASLLVITYGVLAFYDIAIPHGLDIIAGAVVGHQFGRTFKP